MNNSLTEQQQSTIEKELQQIKVQYSIQITSIQALKKKYVHLYIYTNVKDNSKFDGIINIIKEKIKFKLNAYDCQLSANGLITEDQEKFFQFIGHLIYLNFEHRQSDWNYTDFNDSGEEVKCPREVFTYTTDNIEKVLLILSLICQNPS